MTTTPQRDVLGTGWRFPPVPAGGKFELRFGPSLVRQSILVILGTERGERLMRPDFGCGLRRYVMEPNNPTTRAAIARDVTAAIDRWEPRVRLDTVDVLATDDPSVVTVSIGYTLVRDQSLGAVQVGVPVGAARTDSQS
jgi:phage baseplate assembly protein W